MNKPREKYFHNNNLIYEWEQTLEEIHVYFFPPKWALPKYRLENLKQFGPNYKLPKFSVKIESNHLKVQIENEKPFIDVF